MYTFCTLKSNLADRPDISFHLGSAGNALERMNFTSIISGQLSYPILLCSVLSYSMVSCPILWYPVLSYPMVSCPILSYGILSYPILSKLTWRTWWTFHWCCFGGCSRRAFLALNTVWVTRKEEVQYTI